MVALGQSDLVVHIFVCVPIFFFDSFFRYSLVQDIEYSSLCCTINPFCVPILYLVVCIC